METAVLTKKKNSKELEYEPYDWEELRSYVEAARSGSQRAWEYLKKKYEYVISCNARMYFFRGSEDIDVVSTAEMGFYKGIMGYRHKAGRQLGAFLTLCVRRELRNALRFHQRNKRRLLTDALRPDDLDMYGEEFSDREIIARIINEDAVQRFLHILTDIEKKSIMMLADEYSYEEIAGSLKCSTKSVDNAISRVKRKWKEFQNYE